MSKREIKNSVSGSLESSRDYSDRLTRKLLESQPAVHIANDTGANVHSVLEVAPNLAAKADHNPELTRIDGIIDETLKIAEHKDVKGEIIHILGLIDDTKTIANVRGWWIGLEPLTKAVIMKLGNFEPTCMVLKNMVRTGLLPYPENLIIADQKFSKRVMQWVLLIVGTYFGQIELLPLIPIISKIMDRVGKFHEEIRRAIVERRAAKIGQTEMFIGQAYEEPQTDYLLPADNNNVIASAA